MQNNKIREHLNIKLLNSLCMNGRNHIKYFIISECIDFIIICRMICLLSHSSSTIVCFSGSSKGWLAFQVMYTHWSQLWNMPVKTKSWSKHLSWWVIYWLQGKLFLNSVPKKGTLNVSRLQKKSEILLPERFIMNSYTNCVILFQSSTYSTMLWKSLSGLL